METAERIKKRTRDSRDDRQFGGIVAGIFGLAAVGREYNRGVEDDTVVEYPCREIRLPFQNEAASKIEIKPEINVPESLSVMRSYLGRGYRIFEKVKNKDGEGTWTCMMGIGQELTERFAMRAAELIARKYNVNADLVDGQGGNIKPIYRRMN